MNYQYVVIEREYASGGRIIAGQVAEKLGIPHYGREILEMAAQRGNMPVKYLEDLEETVTNSFLLSLYTISQAAQGRVGITDAQALHLAEIEIIQDLVRQGPCVFVGRCAASVLKGRADVLHVYIYADLESRRLRAVNEYGVDEQKVDAHIRKTDQRRANYYRANTGSRRDNLRNYHLALDSGKLGIERCTEVILSAIR